MTDESQLQNAKQAGQVPGTGSPVPDAGSSVPGAGSSVPGTRPSVPDAESPWTGMSELAFGGPANLVALPFFGKVLIRGDGNDSRFCAAAESALGVALPLEPNTTAALSDGGVALWLGPTEWLAWTPKRGELLSSLSSAWSGADIHSAAVDVSDYYAVLRLSGDLSREALSHGCPLDLHPRVFTPGRCAQTRFRAAPILIFQRDDAPTYEVQTRWSFAEYLRRYLLEVSDLCAAARERMDE